MEPVLELSGLRVEYRGDGRTVVGADDVSFSIGAGEIFGLAGESGCGKSTIANAVMRLLKPRRRSPRAASASRGGTSSPWTHVSCAPSDGGRSRWSSSRR